MVYFCFFHGVFSFLALLAARLLVKACLYFNQQNILQDCSVLCELSNRVHLWPRSVPPHTHTRTVELSNKGQNGTEVKKISLAAVWYYPASGRIMAYVWRQETNSVKLLFRTVVVPNLSLCFLSLYCTLSHMGNNGMKILKSESEFPSWCCWILV